MPRPIIVIAGVGNAAGTGAAVAREYARSHRVALVGRQGAEILAKELGSEAQAFTIEDYTWATIENVFRRIRAAWPDSHIKTAIWNTAQWSRIPFLDITERDIELSLRINVLAAFAFAQQAIRAFLEAEGGTLLITGATSATRGAKYFGAFAAGKHGLRAMAQTAAREYGPKGVHVCFVIVDGVIETPRIEKVFGKAEADGQRLDPVSIAKAYRWLDEQDRSAWTFELDLRPAVEHF